VPPVPPKVFKVRSRLRSNPTLSAITHNHQQKCGFRVLVTILTRFRLPKIVISLGPVLGTTSVQLSERKAGLLTPKRHQLKHLEFVLR
jgi:hypothetical protein